MEWNYWVYAVSIQSLCCFAFYIFGERAGLRAMEKRVEHITEVLVQQHYEIVELKKLTVRSVKDIRTKVFGSLN